MIIFNTVRVITLTAVFAASLSSANANAQPGQQSGQRRGPPPEAIEACADQIEGGVCSFSSHRGDVTGVCMAGPQGDSELACAPEGGRPQERGED